MRQSGSLSGTAAGKTLHNPSTSPFKIGWKRIVEMTLWSVECGVRDAEGKLSGTAGSGITREDCVGEIFRVF